MVKCFSEKIHYRRSSFVASQNALPVDEHDEGSPRVALARILAGPGPRAAGYAGADHRLLNLSAV